MNDWLVNLLINNLEGCLVVLNGLVVITKDRKFPNTGRQRSALRDKRLKVCVVKGA